MAAQYWHVVVPRVARSSFLRSLPAGRPQWTLVESHRLTLPAQRRLRRKADFDAAYAHGRRFGNGFFGVTAFLNDKGGPRLGLAVAVRTAGGGVERNRIRRIIRESFRLHQHELPSVDLIVSARGRAKDAPRRELHASLAELWKKVTEQCATLPRS